MTAFTNKQGRGERSVGCWNYSGQHVAALLVDYNSMLIYATDKGIFIAKEGSKNVAGAGQAFARGSWTDEVKSNLYATKSKLAAAVKPVSFDSTPFQVRLENEGLP